MKRRATRRVMKVVGVVMDSEEGLLFGFLFGIEDSSCPWK